MNSTLIIPQASMLDRIAAAFERQDYHTASNLLKELLKQSPDDPWVKLYLGRLQEASGKPNAAEEIYRQLLRTPSNPKLMTQARQGLERLGAVQRQQKRIVKPSTSSIAFVEPANQPLGFLVLESVQGDSRPAAIQTFSRVMQVDPYTARSILPSRGWRLYRTASADELHTWGKTLTDAGLSAVWATLPTLQDIRVFYVHYLQTLSPKVVAVCQNTANEWGEVSFNWTDVAQRVEGVLPIFSPIVDIGYRDRLEWKEDIGDYAHFCDLHLPQRNCILRIHDGKYDFHRSAIANQPRETIRQHWNALINEFNQVLSQAPVWSDFTFFAETAADFATPLSRLKPHIRLSRANDYYLDSAFHLYSTLLFLKSCS